MSRPKSFLKALSVDVAKRAHNCQHNSKHRIQAGETRLGLRNARSTEYFCTECAQIFLENGIKEIRELTDKLKSALI